MLRFNVPVNNFSVMSGLSHCFLGITSTFWEVNILLKDKDVEGLYYLVVKTEVLISFAVTAKLICVFVFAYAKRQGSYMVCAEGK